MSTDSVLFVFVAALLTALATGLGALPLGFGSHGARRWLGAADGAAAGVMLGASAGLVYEGLQRNGGRTVLGALLGGAFVLLAHRVVDTHDAVTLGTLRGADARRAVLIVAVMTAHSAGEGIGIGAAFGSADNFGALVAIAIAIQNVPEGLAISLVLVPRGARVRSAAAWSVFSSLPQPLLAVPAFLFVDRFAAVLPLALGFAAGAMVWVVGRDLLPEAFAQAPRRTVLIDTTLAFAAMAAMQLALTR